MTDEQFQKLREPFENGQVGKLPRVTCKACSEARDKHCDQHEKKKCQDCGNFITTAHVHLDYVGHAAVTDRLLQVDPEWSWRFLAANQDGSPVVFTQGLADPFAKVGIWGEVTVCGVTRPAFGEGKNFKEAIGDLLRNGAMRFGVGLDLWSKEDLHGNGDEHSTPQAAPRDVGASAGSSGRGGERPSSPAHPPATPAAADGVFRFPSGKHAGKTLDEAGRDYCLWYAINGPRDDVKAAIKAHFEVPDANALPDELLIANVRRELFNRVAASDRGVHTDDGTEGKAVGGR